MQNSPPTPMPPMPSRGGPVVPVPTATDLLYIRVRQAVLPSPQQSPGHFYLIEGTFLDIGQYAGTTLDWIIKIAHLICDPLGVSQVFTHTTGTASDWYSLDRDASWQQVTQGDLLHPGIYEFEPNHPITLSKISERQNHSLTTPGSESSASTFRRHIILRDSSCVVTGSPVPTVASHLIPKRIGSDGVKAVVERFVGVHEASGVHRFDPKIGILLVSTLDYWVDNFELGFYSIMNNDYTLHNFNADHPNLSVLGASTQIGQIPLLHGYPVTLSVHAGERLLPPQGVFDWHYLQCVIKRFGTPEYKAFPDIFFFELPFKTASDSSDEENIPDDMDPPYPSYHFDRYLEKQWEIQWARERNKKVSQWAYGVPAGTDQELAYEG